MCSKVRGGAPVVRCLKKLAAAWRFITTRSRRARAGTNWELVAAYHHCISLMHSIRPRPICRARNSFSPSVAVWQQFIAWTQFPPQCTPRCAFTTRPTEHRDHEDAVSSEQNTAGGIRRVPRKRVSGTKSGSLTTRYITLKEVGPQAQMRRDVEKLLAQAYEAYKLAKDYEGVVIKPLSHISAEFRYPWTVKNRRLMRSGHDRYMTLVSYKEHQLTLHV